MSAFLSVSLASIVANWQLLQSRHAKKNSAAVVKANAYGLGMAPVARALQEAGCKTFFVATLEEGIALRKELSSVPIYVFHGVGKNEEKEFIAHHLRPVLNSPEQVARWHDQNMPAALHIDTGMNRLGLSESELAITNLPPTIDLLMSHLACGSNPSHPLNAEQLARFSKAQQKFPGVACSFANSSAHFLGSEFHFDLGRPGCSLYGISPNPSEPNPMAQVATLTAPIIQIRHIDQDGTIGYGATVKVTKGMKTATLGFGYADGLQRVITKELNVWIGEQACPMLGRVSMDMTCYDVSHIPDATLEKIDTMTIIGRQQTVDDVARICGTIGYEIFTRIGNRVRRLYS